jgi:4-amino-4-deoxy-L-arabinose transferase-like glycosyltransferase
VILAAMVALHVLALVARWLVYGSYGGPRVAALAAYAAMAGVAVAAMPASWHDRIVRLKRYAVHHDRRALVALSLCVFALGAAYASYRSGRGPDEEPLLHASRVVAEHGVGGFFAGYAALPWLGYQHPPLVPLLYGFAIYLFGVDLFGLRLSGIAAMVGTMVLTWDLARVLYDRATALFAALFLLSFSMIARLESWALGDMLATFLFALAMRALVSLDRRPSALVAVAAGAAIGFGTVTNYVTGLAYPVVAAQAVTFGWFTRRRRHMAIALAVSLSVLAVWLLYAWWIGVLLLHAESLGDYARVTTGTASGMRWSLGRVLVLLPSGLGASTLPFIALGVLHLTRRRSDADWFLLLWLAPVIGAIALTTPDPRYFLLATPALAIVAGQELERRPAIQPAVLVLTLLLWIPKVTAGLFLLIQ